MATATTKKNTAKRKTSSATKSTAGTSIRNPRISTTITPEFAGRLRAVLKDGEAGSSLTLSLLEREVTKRETAAAKRKSK